jgi:hypothetical protein
LYIKTTVNICLKTRKKYLIACALYGVIVLLMTNPPVAYGSQPDDSLKNRSIGLYFFPYAFYTPETHLALGAAAISYFRTTSNQKNKPSRIIFTGYYSTRKQYYLSLAPELYLKNEKFRILVNTNFGKYANKFWGVGNRSPDTSDEDYIFRLFSFRAGMETRLVGRFNAGGILEANHAGIPNKKNNPFLSSGTIRGSNGGNSVGIGISLSYDSRNNIFYSSKGIFSTFNFIRFSSSLGSDFDYSRYLADFRAYFNPLKQHILALQVYGHFTAGLPPFYELPALGGQNYLRGYFQGRYRDRNFMMIQMEYRTIIFWKIGMAIFTGIGDVYHNLSKLQWSEIKYSLGGGLRFVLNSREKLNVRMDTGYGRNTSGVYFAIEEAF